MANRLVGVVALVLTLATVARAQELNEVPIDAPFIATVDAGTATMTKDGKQSTYNLKPGLYLNKPAADNVRTTTDSIQRQLNTANASNAKLQGSVDLLTKSPPLNIGTILIVGVSMLVVGAAAGAGFELLHRR